MCVCVWNIIHGMREKRTSPFLRAAVLVPAIVDRETWTALGDCGHFGYRDKTK